MLSPVQPGRRPGLQPAHPEAMVVEGLDPARRSTSRPTARRASFSGPTWISPFRNVPVVTTTWPARSRLPSSRATPATRPRLHQKRADLAHDDGDLGVSLKGGTNPRRVPRLVGLRPRRPHRRTTAAIQQLELNARRVNRLAHQPAQRVDFTNQVTLGGPANRWIAGHLPYCVQRQRHHPHPATQTAPPPTRLQCPRGPHQSPTHPAGSEHPQDSSGERPRRRRESRCPRTTHHNVRRPGPGEHVCARQKHTGRGPDRTGSAPGHQPAANGHQSPDHSTARSAHRAGEW